MSLTYELIGTVSNDELLDLLDLALSRDTLKYYNKGQGANEIKN